MYPNKKLKKVNSTPSKLSIQYTSTECPRNDNLGSYTEIDKVKNKIEKVNQSDWTRIRKYTNKYESPLYNSSRKVISRAFYKLWEMMHDHNIQCNSETLHLCDAPGGFIQSVIDYKSYRYNSIKKCHTISLSNVNDPNVPKYHPIIKGNVNVNILECQQGDITNPSVYLSILKELKNTEVTFITADGGITENGDYNNKENIHTQLILSQVYTMCLVLMDKGSFILKIFDVYTDATVHILYLLNLLFDSVEIVKPLTSRPTNSEKYLVCKGYNKGNFTIHLKNELFKCLKKLYETPDILIYKLFDNVPESFYKEISVYNKAFINQQTKHIQLNLDLLKNPGSRHASHNHSNKNSFSKEWLKKYKLIA